jgi:cytoskeletal protein CcmA (bactofilin family)
MRFTFIPWVVLSTAAFASGEVTVPCSCNQSQESGEAIETVTRDISLAAHAQAESLESMTGSITLRRDAHVTGDVETGNGALVLEPGSEVAGDLENDTGMIRIEGARVGGRVVTTYGDIYVGADSQVVGGILVHTRNVIGLSFGEFKLGVPMGRSTPPRVVIGPRAKVAGPLRFKRKVELLVSESATIGPVEGATPVMFATEEPPPAVTKD